MSSVTIGERIQAEFKAREDRKKQADQSRAHEAEAHKQRLERFTKLCEELKSIWGPRIQEFAKQFGDKIKVTPSITPTMREARIVFLTELANMTLTISATTNPDATKLLLNYELQITPTFIEYERHAQLDMPLDAIDREKIGAWVDDHLLACVKAYLAIQDNEHYLRWSMVEDPISKTKLLRSDAAATIEHTGKTLYFTTLDTLKEFKRRHDITV